MSCCQNRTAASDFLPAAPGSLRDRGLSAATRPLPPRRLGEPPAPRGRAAFWGGSPAKPPRDGVRGGVQRNYKRKKIHKILHFVYNKRRKKRGAKLASRSFSVCGKGPPCWKLIRPCRAVCGGVCRRPVSGRETGCCPPRCRAGLRRPPCERPPKDRLPSRCGGAFCGSMVGVLMLHHRFLPVIFPCPGQVYLSPPCRTTLRW